MPESKKLKIWGRANSGNVKKVLIVADELKIPYERVDAGMQFGVVNTPEYRALNPNGRIPTLEDGDVVLWESNSICRYLAMKYGGEAIYPLEPALRARVDGWLDWQLSTIIAADVPLFWGTIRTPPEKQDKAAIAENAKKLADILRILDATLGRSSWLVAGRITLADLVLGIFAYRYMANPFIEKADLPKMKGWLDRLLERPSYREHVNHPLN